MTPERDTDVMGGFAKGLSVLEAFGRGRERLTIAEVSRLTGLDRATSRRCLTTLSRLGYATHDGRFFSLTVRVLALGHAYLASTPLPNQIQPFLDGLAATLQESCSCSILDGTEIVYIARAMQRRVMSIGLGVGSHLPAYCSSMGRVLLAAMPNAAVGDVLDRSDIQPLTPRTLTERCELLAEIERVRQQGFAIIDEELEIGLRSLAVPITTTAGRVVAAINTGAQTSRVTLDRLRDDVLPRLLEVQAKLARVVV